MPNDAVSSNSTGLRSGNFRRYWATVAISGTGNAMSVVVLPIIAATALGANPAQMATIAGLGMVPGLLLQVLAAPWGDRLEDRIRATVLAQLVLGLSTAVIPVLWWIDRLTFPALLAVVLVKAIAGVVLGAASGPVLVQVVGDGEMVAASGRISGTRSATDIAGQAAGGALLAVLAGPTVLMVDALSFFIGAACTNGIRLAPSPRDPSAETQDRRSSAGQLLDIAKGLVRQRSLWCLVVVAFVNGLTEAVFIVYCLSTLSLNDSAVGLLVALGAVGGVLGGFSVGRIAKRLGRHTLSVGMLATMASLSVLPFVGPGPAAAIGVVSFELMSAFGGTTITAVVMGSLQAKAAASGTVARTMALSQNALQVAALLGLVAGGAIGSTASPRAALVTAAIVLPVLSLPVLWQIVGPKPASRPTEHSAPDGPAPASRDVQSTSVAAQPTGR